MADAYRLKADASLPRAIREVETLVNGEKVYETEGRNYPAGAVVLARDISPPLREKAEAGELDHLLEKASEKDYEEYLAGGVGDFSVFIPEHEAEAVVLEEYGHETVPRDQVLELASAGADEAKKAQEEAKKDGADERPGLTAPEVPALNEGKAITPDQSEPVEDSALIGVEKPPGIPTGEAKAALEGAKPKTRQRPSSSSSSSSEKKSESK